MGKNLKKKALILSYFTLGYNIIEGVIAVALGIVTGSAALIGFGSDSFVESLSGGVMIWRFSHKSGDDEEAERREEKAQKYVGVTFLLLGTYVLYESVKNLLLREPSDPSLISIVIAVLSLLIMPTLTYLKYNLGKELKSKSLVADSKQTLICVLMSLVLLIGLGANYLYSIWWIDPLVGLLFVIMLYREGYEAFEGDED